MKIFIQDNIAGWNTSIYIIKEDANGQRFIAKPIKIEFEAILDNFEIKEPTLNLRRNEGQEFLKEFAQALIDAGYRDKSISKDGEINRMQSHLEDMRKIAFKFIDLQGQIETITGHKL